MRELRDWQGLWRRLLPRRQLEIDLDDEIAFHIEEEVERLIADGLPEVEARARVVCSFGDISRTRAEMAALAGPRINRQRMEDLMDGVFRDIRLAARSLALRPGFSAVVILTLALGIGANTAIFSVVNGVLLRPLPYPESGRLVTVSRVSKTDGSPLGSQSQPDIHDLEAGSPSLESLAGYSGGSATLTGLGEPEVVPGARVTRGLLAVFGLTPALGRDIRADENVPDGPNVVVISHEFWTTHLGSDPGVLGSTLELSATNWEIVGVAPEGFDFPNRSQLWRPVHLDVEGCGRGCHLLRTVGRLAPDASLAPAQQEITTIATNLEEAYVDTNYDKGFLVEALAQAQVKEVRTALLVLLASVVMVLFIACANVANLLLVRGADRAGEVALRSALGASRGRVLAQLLVENFLLAALGGGLGLLLAHLGLESLLHLAPDSLPRIDEVSVDGTVLFAALGTVGLVALLFGLIPAMRLARSPISGTLHRGGRGLVGGRGRDRSRSLLLVGEVTLSLMLLLGSTLLLRSFSKLSAVDMGFDTEALARFTISLPDARYPTPEENVLFFEVLEEQIRSVPGVRSVGSVFGSPFGRVAISASFELTDRPPPPPGQEPSASFKVVSPGFFETLGVPLLRGRFFGAVDRLGNPPAVLVTQRFADRFFPGEDPLGRPIRSDVSFDLPETEPRVVVGVVGDIRYDELDEAPVPTFYVPQAQMVSDYLTVMVRYAPGASPMPTIRSIVRELDPDLPLRYVEEMTAVVEEELGPARFNLLLLGIFAALAVILATVGLYGVVAYLVSQRTREIAIRMALGAKGREVTRMVLAQGVRPALVGVFLGIGGAWMGARVLASLLYNVTPTDPISFFGATALLVCVAVLAVLVPATRASRVAPMSALKQE
jgi:predicted permease